MAARDGEEIVATLFGDIHYFYDGEDVTPRHHRFDKGSYVYLFENAHERRCRIEIANHAGTEDQDAFDGFLDQTHVRYSYKQNCMVSLTVAQNVPQDEWHLPTYDPRNENKYHYKLHSLDIYFWTDGDALQFISGVRRVLPPAQVEVLDESVVVQPGAMSAVVQNLEQVAISDPQYAERQSSARSTSTQQNSIPVPSSASTALSMDNLPPPPPMPQYMQQQQQQQQQQKAATNFAPMAYNPAAPVAPETVVHREKTPPPDEDPLNPLAVAVAHDYQGQPFTPAFPHTQFPAGVASPGFAPSGMASPRMAPPSFGGPPAQPGIHRAQTMPVHAGLASPGLNSGFPGASVPGPPSFAPPPTAAQSPPAAPASAPAPAPVQPPPPVASAVASPPPLGGYSNYNYSNPTPAQNGGLDYSIHQQVYRPTEVEMSAKLQPYQPKQETKSKLEQKAGKLENGVTGMLKRFEKKFG
ncbi:hypothetical protein ISF_07693 [Cordyceps fumosorosea ARSEF 2679]|uniref:RNA recognition motif-containing protein n=1 Tax=Cordyceps fumosorosea (strain ARSEF 2679) TaxID=1081104 RepID=A0A162IEQ7_CORFA|nr:hypothetical protein ISF_07693 [Cordyceps fumosorosea ARSEF 2679]OAA56095.1 hypothetical protein ISF_07693 [Cordyceps fumosorosea ARSEF 2679]